MERSRQPKNMRANSLVWFVLTVAVLNAHAESQVLATKIANAIRSVEPGWRYTTGILNAPPPVVPNRPLLDSVWEHTAKNGKPESVDVKIFEVDSRTDAEMSLSPVREGKVHAGWRVKRFDIGDEGFLGTFRNGKRFAIHFRKGAVVVEVSSDSFRLAERFARYVAAQV